MRIVKISLIAVGAFLALAIAAIAYVSATFDPNDYKGFITDTFASRTGRTLAIDEDLRLAYFPWLAVETGGVTIGGAPGFGDAPFATANRVAARVKLLPLLEKRVEIGTVELTGFTLNLARDSALRGNWEDLVEALNGNGTQARAEPGAAAVESFAIEGVRIADGNIYWRENVSELRYGVTGLSLTTGGIGSGEPVDFDAALQVKDEVSGLVAALEAGAVVAIEADGSITATGVSTDLTVTPSGGTARTLTATADRIAFDKVSQALAVDGLATETAGVAATWQIAGSDVLDNPRVQGSVSAPSADLAALLAALEIEPPAGLDRRTLGTAALEARFDFQAEPQVLTLSALQAQALGATVRGNGTLTGGNALSGSIEIPEFAPGEALQNWLRSSLPETVDVSAIDRLALRTEFDTTLDASRISLRNLEASALGATIRGNVETAPGARGNVFRGNVTTSRFAADGFAKAFAASLPPNLAPSELGTIELDARFELDQGADTLSIAPFSAALFGLSASGEIAGRNVSQTAAWSGTAKIAQFSPQALLQRFGLPPQPTSDSEALTRATLEARFAVTGERAELSNVALTLDDTKITGSFTLVGFDAPAYRFALDVDRVNADRYLPPKARDAQEGEATAGDIELPQNNTMDLDGTMRIGALELAGMQFQEVGARVLIGGGDAKLENARAKLYGGTFDGNFHVRAAGNQPGLALDGRAAGLALEPLITALTGETANFSGTGSFDLNLSGTGRTVIENVRTAGGNVAFDMTSGSIKGFNLGHALCSAYNVTQRAPAPSDQPKETVYEGIKGSAVVTAGTAESRDLIARTSFMDLTASGTLKLVEQELDYRADARLTGGIPIPGCETLDQFVGDALPFNIKGTVTAPSITPDFSKLVQRQIREEVQERIQERLQDRLRDILRDR